MKNLGNFIRLARRQLSDMSLITLSDKTGISYGVLQKIEAGTMKSYPEKDILLSISHALKLNYSDLVDLIYSYRQYGKSPAHPPTQTDVTHIPILTWSDIPKLAKSKTLPKHKPADTILAPPSQRTRFALPITTTDWYPFLYPNDIIIVSLWDASLNSGYILGYNPTSKQTDIKRLEKTPKGTLLLTLQGHPNATYVNTKTQSYIVGQIDEVRRQLNEATT